MRRIAQRILDPCVVRPAQKAICSLRGGEENRPVALCRHAVGEAVGEMADAGIDCRPQALPPFAPVCKHAVIFERFCRRLQADADARHAVNQWEILRAEMIHRRRLAQRRTRRACNRVDQIVRFFHVAALIDADINLIIPALFLCMRGKRFQKRRPQLPVSTGTGPRREGLESPLFLIVIGHLVSPRDQAVAYNLVAQAKLMAERYPFVEIRKIEGKTLILPAHPFDHGGICAIGLPVPRLLHDARRDGMPAKRAVKPQVGPKHVQMRL